MGFSFPNWDQVTGKTPTNLNYSHNDNNIGSSSTTSTNNNNNNNQKSPSAMAENNKNNNNNNNDEKMIMDTDNDKLQSSAAKMTATTTTSTTPHNNTIGINGSRVRVVRGGKVYDITNFVDKHPGGREILEQHNGQDVDQFMDSAHHHIHSKTAYQILDRYYLGSIESLHQQAQSETSTLSREEEYYKNDIVDWNKPIMQQISGLGEKYFAWTHEPVDRSLRLFESDFVEYFSKAPWFIVPVLWLPLMAFQMVSSFKNLSQTPEVWPSSQSSFSMQHGVLSIPVLFLAGALFWTLLEYVIHRWLFHLRPPSNWPSIILLHFILHGQHHKSPMDSNRLVFPPVPASLFAIAFYTLCVSLFPIGMAQAVFAGIVFGYFTYDMTHYYIHHGKPFFAYFQRLKSYHAMHHYEQQELGFGISSKLWDFPFGTLIPDKTVKKDS